jgi:hypothetical protein
MSLPLPPRPDCHSQLVLNVIEISLPRSEAFLVLLERLTQGAPGMHVCKAYYPACGLHGEMDSVEILPAGGYPGWQSTRILFGGITIFQSLRFEKIVIHIRITEISDEHYYFYFQLHPGQGVLPRRQRNEGQHSATCLLVSPARRGWSTRC